MKLFYTLTAIVLFGSLMCGCTEPQRQSKTQLPGLKVNITDGDQFPEYLVGTWRQKHDQIWREFVFTHDGYLESVVLAVGSTRMYPGQTIEKPLIEGGQSIFVPGQWDATFSLEERRLEIEINIDSFSMQVRDQILEGRMKEYFVGTISEDGLRWDVTYITLPEYYATTDETGTKALMKGDETTEEKVTFYKVLPQK